MLDLLPDLFDHYENDLMLLPSVFRQFGGKSIFWGEIVTVRCFEDNSMVKQLLATDGTGKVLLVDGGASTAKALMGDLIAQSAVDHGWQGVVIYGAVRDVATLATMPLGVKALAAVPIKTERKGVGDINCTLTIGDVQITPGMMLYADDNGIAVSQTPLNMACIS
ncbi:putative 4-hydroxy-4-methyl-2-oxoglutarate aldolase [Shewanella carassii]|uniref:4-hydroxy-4-methyl-2-oxoglutarate aldolase n=1 Tax=Shewanella carassii TaxID=1987584 RepID=A0ABQ1STL9_9GAMM|nr:putative 4-hydroxy-4-methyl-2-oxoglutarate aldolase [Shewanella carassii]BCV66783.1 putative 4-hydroxy-4-methyl-2-oxoglutarate aldolase [Shewanella carassii]GGE64317.1 putative 4-hydroxy-4-methyl-2-oxoglutarate aldolase [Shewanella carassii]